jgi:hypothetical protein
MLRRLDYVAARMTTASKLSAVGAAVVAAAMVWLIQNQSVGRQRAETELRQQADAAAALAGENERLSNALAQARSAQSITAPDAQELLKLRGEVGRLRQESKELARVREENRQLRASLSVAVPESTSAPAAPEPKGKLNFTNLELTQVLALYRTMSGMELETDPRIGLIHAGITITNSEPVTMKEAVRQLDQALLEQAGIVVTHTATNRARLDPR